MSGPIDDPALDALVDHATRQLTMLFTFLEDYNLQPHEHDRVAGNIRTRLSKKDERLKAKMEEKWAEHPVWGTPPPAEYLSLLGEGDETLLLEDGIAEVFLEQAY